MAPIIKNFIQDETGATAIEYSLIAALVGLFLITALTALGGSLNDFFVMLVGELEGMI